MPRFYIVDAFSNSLSPGSGNTAAVIINHTGTDKEKQVLAFEFGFSETCFVDICHESMWSLRWFTPTTEVPLCGHGTLASAACMNDMFNESVFKFQTLSGVLEASCEGERGVNIQFPLADCKPIECTGDVANICSVLSISSVTCLLSIKTRKLILVVSSICDIESLSPNKELLQTHDGSLFRGVLVVSKGDTNNFYMRYFAPWNGIVEDPVNGSSQSAFASYCKFLSLDEYTAEFCSPRGGKIYCKIDTTSVQLRGNVTFVVKGDLV